MAERHPVVHWADLPNAAAGIVALSGRHDLSIPMHAHDFWELQFGVRGRARHETEDGVEDFVRGTAILLRPGVWHRKNHCQGLVSWACCWPTQALQQTLASALSDPRLAPLLRQPGAARVIQLDEAATRRCIHHLTAIAGASPVARSARVLLLLDELAQQSALAPPLVHIPSGLVRVMDAIDEAPGKSWTVAGVARLAGLSLAHCNRCCRALTGGGLLDYLTRRRLERALPLLISGELSITRIANQCGFSDPAYFARCFRRHHGVSPRIWQQRTKVSS